MSISFQRDVMMSLLELRRDKRYRSGVLQLAVMLEIIDQREWESLTMRYVKKPAADPGGGE